MTPLFRPLNRSNRESGFTLLEMLISLAVFSVGMLGLTSLFAMQIGTNANAIRHNVVNNLALNAIEEAKAVPYYRMANWDPGKLSATVPCQGDAVANLAHEVDCLTPDTLNPAAPAAPYDHFVSDVGFVSLASLTNPGNQVGQGAAQEASYTKGMEVRRTFTITPAAPVPDMKTITVQVEWRLAGNQKIHTIAYTTVRDMDIR